MVVWRGEIKSDRGIKMENINDLAIKYDSDKSVMKHNYCFLYNLIFQPNWNSILEIGVDKGASINMWIDTFRSAEIYGIDIFDSPINHKRYTHIVGDQSKESTYISLRRKQFDLIIDDGSHKTEDIMFTFDRLIKNLKDEGIYIVEDLDCKKADGAIEKLIQKGFYIINNKLGIYQNGY